MQPSNKELEELLRQGYTLSKLTEKYSVDTITILSWLNYEQEEK